MTITEELQMEIKFYQRQCSVCERNILVNHLRSLRYKKAIKKSKRKLRQLQKDERRSGHVYQANHDKKRFLWGRNSRIKSIGER